MPFTVQVACTSHLDIVSGSMPAVHTVQVLLMTGFCLEIRHDGNQKVMQLEAAVLGMFTLLGWHLHGWGLLLMAGWHGNHQPVEQSAGPQLVLSRIQWPARIIQPRQCYLILSTPSQCQGIRQARQRHVTICRQCHLPRGCSLLILNPSPLWP